MILSTALSGLAMAACLVLGRLKLVPESRTLGADRGAVTAIRVDASRGVQGIMTRACDRVHDRGDSLSMDPRVAWSAAIANEGLR